MRQTFRAERAESAEYQTLVILHLHFKLGQELKNKNKTPKLLSFQESKSIYKEFYLTIITKLHDHSYQNMLLPRIPLTHCRLSSSKVCLLDQNLVATYIYN